MKLVAATGNAHKLEELRQILGPLGIELLSMNEFPNVHDVVEDRPTIQGNAIKKAVEIQAVVGLPVIADDTGLEVDALDGRPGVFSARYAGENATYDDNVEKLLGEMQRQDNRDARFRTVIAYTNGKKVVTFEGICEGEILEERRGEKGFGYDPVFKPSERDLSFAELSEDEKNAISHRGRAVQKFVQWLRRGEA